jgi:two-component system chemotaxis response regulator CheB
MLSGKRLRVLVVDDSVFMCRVLQNLIGSDPELEVIGTAQDGREAITAAERLRPDVITMDINMPRVDGLQATEVIMSSNPRPIIMVSSDSREGATPTLRALGLGAVDFVAKPSTGIDFDMSTVRDELCHKLKLAARVRVVRNATRSPLAETLAAPGTAPAASDPASATRNGAMGKPLPESIQLASWLERAPERFPVVCLAASTGGPATLMRLLPSFPANSPAAVIVIQHMPGTFTAQFAVQLNEVAPARVKEAEQGEPLCPGTVYICPGTHHLRISPGGRIALDAGPRVAGYRPCADVSLESVAQFAGAMTTAVVLTGMGSDGARGAMAVKAAGGHVITQDEATSAVFGMPAEVIRCGAADQVLPLEQIYAAVEKRVLYSLGAARIGAI